LREEKKRNFKKGNFIPPVSGDYSPANAESFFTGVNKSLNWAIIGTKPVDYGRFGDVLMAFSTQCQSLGVARPLAIHAYSTPEEDSLFVFSKF
jgi:hypothetical protein